MFSPRNEIWIYWSESNSWIYFYAVLNKSWFFFFTGLGSEDGCSSWGLNVKNQLTSHTLEVWIMTIEDLEVTVWWRAAIKNLFIIFISVLVSNEFPCVFTCILYIRWKCLVPLLVILKKFMSVLFLFFLSYQRWRWRKCRYWLDNDNKTSWHRFKETINERR